MKYTYINSISIRNEKQSKRNVKNINRLYFYLLFFVFNFLNISADIGGRADLSISHVYGTVYSNEGIPVKNIKISLFSHKESYPNSPLEVTYSDSSGSFLLKSTVKPSYLLEVHCDCGTGRIALTEILLNNPVQITCPIFEEIIILHTNDLHFDLNYETELFEIIKEIRNENKDVFLFSSGDIFVRHPERWLLNGVLMDSTWYGNRSIEIIHSMNRLGYDLLTLGNHELAYIAPYTKIALDKARFPLLAANIKIHTTDLPEAKDFVLFETSTWRKLGVLGLSYDNAKRKGIEEIDLTQTVNKFLYLMDSVDILVALTHIGLKNDMLLAMNFPLFDLIIGGHSHDLLKEAVIENTVLIAQAGGNPHPVSKEHPTYLGIVSLKIINGKIQQKSGKVIPIVPDNNSFEHKKAKMLEFSH